jgi:hypothetical protein
MRELEHRTRKWWFEKDEVELLYSLYALHDNGDVQCINFCREWDWSINTDVPKSYIYAYFYGLLTGMGYAQQKQINENSTSGDNK